VAKIICGVDVSGATLEARIGLGGPTTRVDRTAEGVEELLVFCREHAVELVVFEATGGYEALPFGLLWARGMACAIVNPRSVRRFAEALGFLEKTDRIDAGVIARYAEVKGIVAQEPASAEQQRLRAFTQRLRQLTELRVDQSNQRRLVCDSAVLASIEEILALVRRQIRELEKAIAELLAGDPLWRALDHEFRSIKGVADRTIARVAAEMPEIGLISNKAASKLGGLAPLARDSGKRFGKRFIRGGRRDLRSILFVVAGLVSRHDPDFADMRRRLLAAGKPKMVVRVALARKLLVRLNAKARDVRRELALAA
jgi:transposase